MSIVPPGAVSCTAGSTVHGFFFGRDRMVDMCKVRFIGVEGWMVSVGIVEQMDIE